MFILPYFFIDFLVVALGITIHILKISHLLRINIVLLVVKCRKLIPLYVVVVIRITYIYIENAIRV